MRFLMFTVIKIDTRNESMAPCLHHTLLLNNVNVLELFDCVVMLQLTPVTALWRGRDKRKEGDE